MSLSAWCYDFRFTRGPRAFIAMMLSIIAFATAYSAHYCDGLDGWNVLIILALFEVALSAWIVVPEVLFRLAHRWTSMVVSKVAHYNAGCMTGETDGIVIYGDLGSFCIERNDSYVTEPPVGSRIWLLANRWSEPNQWSLRKETPFALRWVAGS